jgi:hypothetical protein
MRAACFKNTKSPNLEPRARLRQWIASGAPPESRGLDDETALITAAGQQGLAPSLSSAVRDRHDWSDSSRERLKAIELASLVRGIRQLECARRTQELLLARGLRSLPLKGAAVAERFVAPVAHRPMVDVDLLALDDWQESQKTLIVAGLVLAGRADHAAVFRDPTSGEFIELHHALSSCPGVFHLDREGWWDSSQKRGDGKLRLPSTEHTLLHLSIHCAFQHGCVLSLIQYLDFRRVLASDGWSADRLIQRADEALALATLACALRAADIVVGIPRYEVLGDSLSSRLSPALGRRLARLTRPPLELLIPSTPSIALLRWSLTRGRRRVLIQRTFAPIEPGERLAPCATFLLVSKRALRLVKRHAATTLRSFFHRLVRE